MKKFLQIQKNLKRISAAWLIALLFVCGVGKAEGQQIQVKYTTTGTVYSITIPADAETVRGEAWGSGGNGGTDAIGGDGNGKKTYELAHGMF